VSQREADRDWIVFPALSVSDAEGRQLLKTEARRLRKGSVLAIVGPSGAGKSLWLKSLFGWAAPGQSAALAPRRAAHLMIQDPSQGLTPGLSLAGHFRDVAGRDWRHAAEALLTDLGIDSAKALARMPGSFSGGERQRLMLALALARHPRLLCCDEPAAALDPEAERDLWRLLETRKAEMGLTLAFATHQLDLVDRYADTVAVFFEGALVFWGSCRDFFEAAEHPWHRALIRAYRQSQTAAAARESVAEGAPRLEIASFSLKYGERALFDDFRLALRPGEWRWVYGPSGAGKTSLARFAAGLLPEGRGIVRLDGRRLPDRLARRRPADRRAVQLAFQFGSTSLNPSLTVTRQLARAFDDDATARDALAALGLAGRDLERPPQAFSLGEQQRIALARATATRPRVLICDEPGAALDLALKRRIVAFLDGWRAKTGAAVLAITHDAALRRMRPAPSIVLAG